MGGDETCLVGLLNVEAHLISNNHAKKKLRNILVFPKIGGKPPKWMVYNGKPYQKWMIWGAHPCFWKHSYWPHPRDLSDF